VLDAFRHRAALVAPINGRYAGYADMLTRRERSADALE
jgi:hypothetical protein